ncbi:uncharacterized protein LOC127878567 [Dreissena polymorpha]|uniref:Extradiol ring-cleavage dioxygenase class III enzyme subunit B domain-containing protein n=1 Tax=Dreissena polymorpha TaxID=45954 RepID=A0A9D4MQG6_DREPO|nr:uncharacterized protein LOC127878567 [Dreissena polymorpha]KAH3880596.1 hypothetical protein DPMN_004515 [Dreissena polymorpha]
MNKNQPVVFLSHGAGPSFYLDDERYSSLKQLDKNSEAASFLRNLLRNAHIAKPEAILVISAHWEEKVATVNVAVNHSLYYDYGGFPPETYKLQWPVKGAPGVAAEVKSMLEARGIRCAEETSRGLDHGVFVPLKLVFPEADIPVTQLSLLSNMSVADHLAIGEALGELASKGVLIVGSGFATHKGGNLDAPTPQWVLNFRKWLHDALFSERYSGVERKAKFLACEMEETEVNKAHPSLEHFLPILMCSAAAGYRPGRLLYSEFVMSSLLNEHYIFPIQ